MNCVYPNCDDLVQIDPTYEERFFTCENRHDFCSVCRTLGHHDEKKCKRVLFNYLYNLF